MFNLDTPVEQLYLVGPARAKLLKNLGLHSLADLLFYFPRAHADLSQLTDIAQLKLGESATIRARILEIKSFRTKVRRLTITQALVEDNTGSIVCVWFNQPFLTKTLKPGAEFIFSGRSGSAKNKLQLQSPVYEPVRTEQIHTARLVPIYSLTANLTQKQLRTIIKTYLDKVQLPEYLPDSIIQKAQLLGLDQAVREFHFPDDHAILKRAQDRLAFDEIFLTQIRVLQYRQQRRRQYSVRIPAPQNLDEKIQGLPFGLTAGQQQALAEILADFQKPYPANRLLQGDVGSGKTVVAALAMWAAALSGLQTALLSPTEILASQHYANFLSLFKNDGLDLGLLTSSQARLNGNPVSRATLLGLIQTGRIKFILGTHALLEDTVQFKNLGLIVIDEQHRFGVRQRSLLKQATASAHLLTMSATPIPRTLALTLYGDLNISLLKELPHGRLPIITKIVSEDNRRLAYEFIAKQIRAGRQVFVICPLIAESDQLGVKSATAEYQKLSAEIFPQFRVGLLHGKMKPRDKEQTMLDFKNNEIQILVSTSVVEVGVDVPNATIMMIEGAERFGLAQLHQFRGRVGRSQYKSYCFLFSADPKALANPRLQALAQSANGFELAEIDLQIRGAGDLYGTSQSGYSFKIATLSNLEMVEASRRLAENLLAADPPLNRHPLLRAKLAAQPIVHLE